MLPWVVLVDDDPAEAEVLRTALRLARLGVVEVSGDQPGDLQGFLRPRGQDAAKVAAVVVPEQIGGRAAIVAMHAADPELLIVGYTNQVGDQAACRELYRLGVYLVVPRGDLPELLERLGEVLDLQLKMPS